jgi:hypothetical protein
MNLNQTCIFKLQTDHSHILQSFLMALNFTGDLEIRYVKSIVSGFVQSEVFYVSNQKVRGYLEQKGHYLSLSTKAKILIQSMPVKLVVSRSGGDIKTEHEVLLVRTLFLCLLHLSFGEIKAIRKQKRIENSLLVPDLTLVTQNCTLYLEVDTGKQPFKTVQAKIEAYKAIRKAGSVIYFSNSHDTSLHLLQHPLVQVIHLHSQIISQDIEKLTYRGSLEVSSETAEKLCKHKGELLYEKADSFDKDFQLPDDYEKRLEDGINLLNESC